MLKVDETDVQSMTFNGREVNKWVHNGVEVIGDRMIYSAELDFRIFGSKTTVAPISVKGDPFIDTELLDSSNWSNQIGSTGGALSAYDYYEPLNIKTDILHLDGILTDKAYLRYKYVQIHYTYGAWIFQNGSYGQKASCSIMGESVVDINYQGTNYPDTESGSGIITIPITDIPTQYGSTYTFATVSVAIANSNDFCFSGVGITKIVLTNIKPTE